MGATTVAGPGAAKYQHGRVLSDTQIDEAAALREKGWSLARIAQRFEARGLKVSQSAIAWQLLRVGADLPAHRRGPIPAPRHCMRSGYPVRHFTPEEDAQLLALEAEGRRNGEIAKALGRRENSIRGRLMTLARRQARAEDVA
ncbi:hypothetical protein FHS31_000796 [Sphingomonas vulcanisoli]|uniref:Helix-turn-helix domain-containing protein n=2 Tax=Sphingomonas vulcanisoli TaxID=1658060 RepID=A0ABX0TSJ9_9SPHN|nr:hypothetical protein [Sphingomonas vulcanisoli]